MAEQSPWTIESLALHFHKILEERDLRYEQRFEAAQAAFHDALAAQEKAVTKAEIASEKRFDAVNEFRAQLADQATTFLPRQEYQARHDALTEKVDSAVAALGNRIERNTEDLKKNLDTVNLVAAAAQGKGSGLAQGWGILLGAAGLIGTVIAVVYALSK
jgi:hypothetical protein